VVVEDVGRVSLGRKKRISPGGTSNKKDQPFQIGLFIQLLKLLRIYFLKKIS
jgi:hypothetical protein